MRACGVIISVGPPSFSFPFAAFGLPLFLVRSGGCLPPPSLLRSRGYTDAQRHPRNTLDVISFVLQLHTRERERGRRKPTHAGGKGKGKKERRGTRSSAYFRGASGCKRRGTIPEGKRARGESCGGLASFSLPFVKRFAMPLDALHIALTGEEVPPADARTQTYTATSHPLVRRPIG